MENTVSGRATTRDHAELKTLLRQRAKRIGLGLCLEAVGRCRVREGKYGLVGFTRQAEGQRQVNNTAVAVRALQVSKSLVNDLAVDQGVKREGINLVAPARPFAAKTQGAVAPNQGLGVAVGIGNFNAIVVNAVKAHFGVGVGVNDVKRTTCRWVIPIHRIGYVDNLVRIRGDRWVIDLTDLEVHHQRIRGAIEVQNVNGQLFALQGIFCG